MPETVTVFSQPDLHYPITVTKLLVQPNAAVAASDYLFEFTFKSTVSEEDELGNPQPVERVLFGKSPSGRKGTLSNWAISPGLVIHQAHVELATLEVPCTHQVLNGPLCVMCGEAVDEIDYNTRPSDAHVANTAITHTHPALRISDQEANRLDQQAKQRMLNARKLSLVVDLDLTIIHASVDPTIGEWQKDFSNPNHEAVESVEVFELYDEAQQRDVPYYIKLRPHLKEFLEIISKIYELYIYTMGTRAYADNIAKIVDPDKRLFGDRILSRTETPGEDSKNLRKLFPVDNRMVVIIDDRADVWKWSNYLVRVQPFNFFVGIGDINASFLPKQDDALVKDKVVEAPPDPRADQTEGATVDEPAPHEDPNQQPAEDDDTAFGGDQSALQQIVTMQENNADETMEQKTAEQDEKLAIQINERPLLQLQQSLEDERLPNAQNLLKDDDVELYRIQDILVDVHRRFFDEYDSLRDTSGAVNGQQESHDLANIPDVKDVIDVLIPKPLKGARLVFSQLLPGNQNIFHTRLADAAFKLGASIQHDVVKPRGPAWSSGQEDKRNHRRLEKRKRYNYGEPQSFSDFDEKYSDPDYAETHPRVATHVLTKVSGQVSRKMRQAGRRLRHVVRDEWLWDQMLHWWEKLDESAYAMDLHPRNYTINKSDPSESDSSDGSDDEEEAQTGEGSPIMLNGDEYDFMDDMPELDDEDGDEDDGSEVSSSQKSNASMRSGSNKRKREVDDEESVSDTSELARHGAGSKLQMRKRKALERTTSLTNVQAAESDSGGSDASDGGEAEGAADGQDDEDDDPDGLEAAILAAFEEGGGDDDD